MGRKTLGTIERKTENDPAMNMIHENRLEASSFSSEEHRKVWARLRVRDGIRVGRKRLLRIMRENSLSLPFAAGADAPLFTTGGFARMARTR